MGLLDALGRGLSAAGYAAADIYKQKSLDEDRAALETERMARQEEFIKAREARGEERQIAAEGRQEASKIAAEKRALENIGLEATAKAKALSSPEVLEANRKIFENQKTSEIEAFIKQNSDPKYLSALRSKAEAERDPTQRAENLARIEQLKIQTKAAQMELDNKVEINDLYKKANDPKLNPAERTAAREAYQLKAGKDSDRWEVLKTKDAMGIEQIIGRQNKSTGQFEKFDPEKGFVTASQKYATASTEEELRKYPAGTPVLLPSGKVVAAPGQEQSSKKPTGMITQTNKDLTSADVRRPTVSLTDEKKAELANARSELEKILSGTK